MHTTFFLTDLSIRCQMASANVSLNRLLWVGHGQSLSPRIGGSYEAGSSQPPDLFKNSIFACCLQFSLHQTNMPSRTKKIPGYEEWSAHEYNMDALWAYKKLHGKSIEEVKAIYAENEYMASSDDFLYMPRLAFQYYIFAFAEYLRSESARGASDAASVFLNVLIAREEQDSGIVSEIYAELEPTVEFVAENQGHFEADLDIYGSFVHRAEKLRSLCSKSSLE